MTVQTVVYSQRVAEMAFAGHTGVTVDIDKLPEGRRLRSIILRRAWRCDSN